MIVNRRTYNIKFGAMEGALELLKLEGTAARTRGYTDPYRVYVSNIGQFSQIALEWEFETLAALEEFWTSWRPANPEFLEKWFGLQRGEIEIEVWDRVE
jgi:hypothetical protein